MSVLKEINIVQTYSTIANDSLDAIIGSYYLPNGSLDTEGRLLYTAKYNHILRLRRISDEDYADIYPDDIIDNLQDRTTTISYEDSLNYVTFSIDISENPTIYIPVLNNRIIAGILRYYIIDYDQKYDGIDKSIIAEYIEGKSISTGKLSDTIDDVYVVTSGHTLYVISKYIEDTEGFILTATSTKSLVKTDVPLHLNLIEKYKDKDDLVFYVNSVDSVLNKQGSYAIINADKVSLDLVITSATGDQSTIHNVPDGTHILYEGDYRLNIRDVVENILKEEHYLRCILIDYVLNESEVQDLMRLLDDNERLERDNYHYIQVISTCNAKINDERFINVGTEILDTNLEVHSSAVSVFYPIVKSLAPTSYDSVLVRHISDEALTLITDDTAIRDYHYNSTLLDPIIIRLIKSTIVANVMKRIELYLMNDAPQASDLISSSTVEVIAYETEVIDDKLNINLQVKYNHLEEDINLILNYNNYV